jgi:hypothetical protein
VQLPSLARLALTVLAQYFVAIRSPVDEGIG